MVTITHDQNNICSKTHFLDGKQTIIYRKLFPGHVVSCRPMKKNKKIILSSSLALLDLGSWSFRKMEGKSINTRVCDVSFYHAETSLASIKHP